MRNMAPDSFFVCAYSCGCGEKGLQIEAILLVAEKYKVHDKERWLTRHGILTPPLSGSGTG